MASSESVDAVLAAFDDHLARTRGTDEKVRRNYCRYVDAFLQSVAEDGVLDPTVIDPAQVVRFVTAATSCYQPATVRVVVTALRSFFRFLRATGRRADRLEDAVPSVAHRRQDLPRHLNEADLARLLSSLEVASPQGLRDRAMLLCLARLGLRASEISKLCLEDLDWRHATIQITARKTGRGAVSTR